ncbi:bifunctional homocysteine S-methyltransferase/methylenetetrahydrofolate reductase [bacterium]|nr:bifunctional homocysteine S-methyltransferase/methylenetetrahydrofolate reductase [bacterium]
MKPLLQRLAEGPLLGDGAMGTMIYARGVFINRCYDELNLSTPDIVSGIHAEYVAAGAELLETNTFGANQIALAAYGIADKMAAINSRGVEIARAAAGDEVYVAGCMGPTGRSLGPEGNVSNEEAACAFASQAQALAAAGADLIMLDTFHALDELIAAITAVKAAVTLPVVAHFSFDTKTSRQTDVKRRSPGAVARLLDEAGADVVGTNCVTGPAGMLTIVEGMARATHKPVSAFPNAGFPEEHGGRILALGTSPEYMAEYARRLVQSGASIVGGCCGTTPAMIAEMGRFLKGIAAERRSRVFVREVAATKLLEPIALAERSRLGALIAGAKGDRKIISVELTPPAGLDPVKAIRGAKMLKDGGVDIVNIPDGPRAVARMSPIALAGLVRDQAGMETLIHYCCRDRNLLGMQMDLLGANALGLHNVMLITGDPPKVGNVKAATPVFDLDAIGLINMVNRLNRGFGLADQEIHGRTQFVIGAGCNPGAIDLEREIRRFGEKITSGAEFFFSQPVYRPDLLDGFLKATDAFPRVPFFVGILPLASLRNAEFLHNEVPGMQIPEEILKRMRAAESKEEQQREGIRIAQEMLREVVKNPRVKGIYLFPPFGRYESVLEVLEAL